MRWCFLRLSKYVLVKNLKVKRSKIARIHYLYFTIFFFRNDWTIAPEGVFCQRPDIYRKKLPELPDHFSVKIETVDEVQKAVTFSEEYYDFSEKLVAFEFAPRSHAPPAIFFSRFLINSGFPNDLYRIVHDFSSEVQYTLNERLVLIDFPLFQFPYFW